MAWRGVAVTLCVGAGGSGAGFGEHSPPELVVTESVYGVATRLWKADR